ncbi:MAG: CoA transferase [Caulobacteraceae bacterium]
MDRPTETLPLAGVKVLDFSWALVGSFTTKNFADFGAMVIKVESSTRPCLSRIDAQVAASSRSSFDDKPWFIHMNTSKLGLRLNMKHPRWREVIDPLLEWADVVVENFSPGTMASLGLDYATLSQRRPDIIMLSGSVYGQTGPLSREWGVDGTGAALSSRLFLTGWPDRAPVTPSVVPYGDVILPPFMAAAAAAALDYRRRTGKGQHIDASMYEMCVQQMAPALAAAQLDGRPQRMGERATDVLYQGVFPTLGDDRWIAISAADQAAWNRLTEAVGGEWPSAAIIAHAAPALLDEIDRRVGEWTADFDGFALMRELQAAGVAAGVVADASDLLHRDPQLRARGFVEMLDNPALGPFEHLALPYKLSRTPARMTTAPALGQHNKEIVCGVAGLSDGAFQELHASGLFE